MYLICILYMYLMIFAKLGCLMLWHWDASNALLWSRKLQALDAVVKFGKPLCLPLLEHKLWLFNNNNLNMKLSRYYRNKTLEPNFFDTKFQKQINWMQWWTWCRWKTFAPFYFQSRTLIHLPVVCHWQFFRLRSYMLSQSFWSCQQFMMSCGVVSSWERCSRRMPFGSISTSNFFHQTSATRWRNLRTLMVVQC